MKKIILLCSVLYLFSCSNNDDNSNDNENLSIDLVTGIDIRSDENSALIRLGNPNILNEQTIVYPNPAPSALTIISMFSSEISDVWILKGIVKGNYLDTDFEGLLNSNLYSEEALNDNSEESYMNINSSNITINLSEFDEGYYRVFIRINGTIEWHNIYVGAPDISAFIESWN